MTDTVQAFLDAFDTTATAPAVTYSDAFKEYQAAHPEESATTARLMTAQATPMLAGQLAHLDLAGYELLAEILGLHELRFAALAEGRDPEDWTNLALADGYTSLAANYPSKDLPDEERLAKLVVRYMIGPLPEIPATA